MKAETIKQLNTKVWYRFLKVVWGGFWLIALFLGCFINYSNFNASSGFDRQNCLTNIGRLDPYDKEGLLRAIDYSNRTGALNISAIKDQAVTWKPQGESVFDGFYDIYYKKLEDGTSKEFNWMVPAKTTVWDFCKEVADREISPFVSSMSTLFISVFMIFELGRRIFYYIYFGKIKPIKE